MVLHILANYALCVNELTDILVFIFFIRLKTHWLTEKRLIKWTFQNELTYYTQV